MRTTYTWTFKCSKAFQTSLSHMMNFEVNFLNFPLQCYTVQTWVYVCLFGNARMDLNRLLTWGYLTWIDGTMLRCLPLSGKLWTGWDLKLAYFRIDLQYYWHVFLVPVQFNAFLIYFCRASTGPMDTCSYFSFLSLDEIAEHSDQGSVLVSTSHLPLCLCH